MSTPSRDLAEIVWGDNGTPIAARFDDPYYSRLDGRAEAGHVFLGGNSLPERFAGRQGFTIGELGFGTGLNFFETLAAWRAAAPAAAILTYISFERYPLSTEDLRRAIACWPELSDDCEILCRHWPPTGDRCEIAFPRANLVVIVGDVNETLPTWAGAADAWFLDGFSPAKNPDMWGEALLAEVFRQTRPGGTFATFTAAGWVRRNLSGAGFEVQKTAGYGRKRECLKGQKPLAAASLSEPR